MNGKRALRAGLTRRPVAERKGNAEIGLEIVPKRQSRAASTPEAIGAA